MRKGESLADLLKRPGFRTPFTPGVEIRKRGVYVYRCPICGSEMRYDDAYGPACTGPSSSQDEHEMAPMELISVTAPRLTVSL